jgi:vitamin B12 transporter
MKKIATVFFCLFCVVLDAQDTVGFQANMDVVDIVRSQVIRLGVRSDVPDPVVKRIYPAGTLSDLLGTGGMLQLKSYGPGGLATTSSRGANSMQTPVIWNGINLQNITNNTVDLSLLPTFLFDDISFQPGGTSSAWGSGTIGGAIKTNTNNFHRSPSGKRLYGNYLKTKTVLELGSFGAVMTGVQVGYRNWKWTYDLRLFQQINLNRFPYENIAQVNHPREILTHAKIRLHGFLAQASYESGREHVFTARLWVQETMREIPPTMLQTFNDSRQQDYALRATADWNYSPPENFRLITRVALTHEGLVYDPGFNQAVSNTDQWSLLGGSEFYWYFKSREAWLTEDAIFSGGINTTYSSAVVTGFIPYTSQLRASAFLSYGKSLRHKWSGLLTDEFNLTIRQEIVDDKLIDPVGSVWYYSILTDWLAVRVCVSHNYRVPTFNDLYWSPGGNPDLRAETSWTEEGTIELTKKWRKEQRVIAKLEYSVTAYNRDVVDMITWAPYASYWSPKNVARVKSRGMEHRLKAEYNVRSWEFTFLANADYVRSTYEQTENPNDVALGKQLIYVPAWFGGATISVKKYDYFITYSHQYTDLRFTTRDHVEWLPAYNIANLAIGWTINSYDWTFHPDKETKEYRLDVFLRCNNIFNEQYQTVAWRPMPGRCFMIGCTIDFLRRIYPKKTGITY